MKKVFAITIVSAFILTLSLTSCKKDYTCECTFTAPTAAITLPYENVSKKDAQDACDAAEVTYKNADPNASCEIK
jgi:hypothetical protein